MTAGTHPGHRTLLPSLAGMRFLAAATVFLAHVAIQLPFDNVVLGGLLLFLVEPVAFSGVGYFFMLSGFVLTWTRRPDDTANGFFRRRFSRLIPSHLLALSAAVVLALVSGAAVGLPQLLAQAFLVQAWIPDIAYLDVLNSPTWSISAELFCYLLFPVLVPVLLRVRVSRLWALLGAVLTLIVAWPFLVTALVPPSGDPHPLSGLSLLGFLQALADPSHAPQPASGATYTQFWFVYHFPPARLLDFVAGVLIARIVAEGRWPRRLRPRTALLLLVPAWVSALFVPLLFRATCLTIVPMAVLLGSMAARDNAGTRTRLGSTRMVALGNLTYGFYLVHGLVLTYGHQALGTVQTDNGPGLRSFSVPVGLALVVLAFAVTLFLAWLLYRFVETPSTRRWGANRATRSIPVDASTLAGPASDGPPAAAASSVGGDR